MAKPSLWTPDGPVAIGEKESTHVTGPEIQLLAALTQFTQKYRDIALTCTRCGNGFQGLNNDTSKEFVVTCGCRDFRFIR